MAHSYRDRMGGHHCSHVVGYDGDVYWTPGARRFLKRSMKRDQRRQARRITAEALRLLEAEVQDDMREMFLLDMEMFGDNDYDFQDYLNEQVEEEPDYGYEDPFYFEDWDY